MKSTLQEWEQVYRDESPRLWRALLAYSGDPDIAGDSVAEAFTQAISRNAAIRYPASWVWAASFRIAAGELKRRRTLSELTSAELAYEMADPLFPLLMDGLRHLSPNQRAAVVLHDYADRPTHEIAEILGMKLPTVHVHLSQGRKRLRDHLEAHDEHASE